MEILCRDIPWRSVAEILPRGLLHKSCQESFCTELVQTCHKEILPRGLLHKSCQESFCTELVQTSHKEILPRRPLQRSCQQSSYRDLVQRSCQESSYRDLVQGPCAESRSIARRSFLDSLSRDLALRSLQRSFVEISHRHLLHIASTGILHSSFYREPLKRSCA